MNEDMAYGIENARIVVVFLSEPYFNSKNCKKELNYADILDKKGFLIHSMNTYFNQVSLDLTLVCGSCGSNMSHYMINRFVENLQKEILIVKLEKDLEHRGRGSISLITSSKLYVRESYIQKSCDINRLRRYTARFCHAVICGHGCDPN